MDSSTQQEAQPTSPGSTSSINAFKKPQGLASPYMSSLALPDTRTQTYEELYAPPENILEIEVLHVCFYHRLVSF
jgi:hypothetical protein